MTHKGADFKGNGTIPARPHRLSRLVYVPKQIEICRREVLDSIAAMAPEKPQLAPRSFNGKVTPLDLPDFFTRHGIVVKRQTAWNDNTGYELEECVFDPSHNHGEAFVAQFPSGAVSYKCHHSSCSQYKWQDVREKFEPGYRDGVPSKQRSRSRTAKKPNADEEKPKVEAAPPIDVPLTKNLIHELADQIRRFIFFKGERVPLLIATWILATYVHDRFKYFAILWITSPVMRCGKTRLIDILDQLVWRSSGSVVNTSLAALYYMTAEGCTFLADEVENLKNSDREQFGAVIGIVNGGFAKGATVRRMIKIEGDWVQKKFPIYGPKVLAGIATVSDTIRDRSLCIRMIRKSPKEHTERLSMRKEGLRFKELRAILAQWAEQNSEAIEKIYDSLKEQPELKGCDDRFLDIAEPLLSIVRFADAEAANGGGRIIDELMPLLKEMGGLRGEAQNDEAIAALCGLLDAMLGGSDELFIPSDELLEKMKGAAGLQWIHSAKTMATFMSKLDLVSRRDPTGSKRGYRVTKDAVQDIRSRYILLSPDFKASEVSDNQAGRGSEGIL
jgi:hypothetical protein